MQIYRPTYQKVLLFLLAGIGLFFFPGESSWGQVPVSDSVLMMQQQEAAKTCYHKSKERMLREIQKKDKIQKRILSKMRKTGLVAKDGQEQEMELPEYDDSLGYHFSNPNLIPFSIIT